MPAKQNLLITNSADVTSDYLVHRFWNANVPIVRLDTDNVDLSVQIECAGAASHLIHSSGTYQPNDFSEVVLRRPKQFSSCMKGDIYQRKHAGAEWAEAMEGFLSEIPEEKWINSPVRNFLASHKVDQLRRAELYGLCVPEWMVTTRPAAARAFLEQLSWSAVVKPLSSGYIERGADDHDSIIYTNAFHEHQSHLIDLIGGCPVLFQRKVNKRADVRIIYLDRKLVAVALLAEDDGVQRLDIRRHEMIDVTYRTVNVPNNVEEAVIRIMTSYGLRFGALDFAIDNDDCWYFFEINPNGQWAWLDETGVCDIGQLFIKSLSTTSSRKDA